MSVKTNEIVGHYTTDSLLDRIKAALIQQGKNPEALEPGDLKAVDEFHTGGFEATEALLSQLPIQSATRVLDVGCGIGGTARHIAQSTGVTVTGVDLTPDYVHTAQVLSSMVGLADKTSFHVGSALELPMDTDAFDLATMFHVGMNIPDKPQLFSEAARVLSPGGTFALFDVMQTSDEALVFPLPWAERAEWSAVARPQAYKAAAADAGFELTHERNRRDFTIAFFENAFKAIEKSGAPPPVGIHLLMKDTAATKLKNYFANVSSGKIAPFEMVFQLSS